jgi:hypothetical protein
VAAAIAGDAPAAPPAAPIEVNRPPSSRP